MRATRFLQALLAAVLLFGTVAAAPTLTGCKSEEKPEKAEGIELFGGDKPQVPGVLEGIEFGMPTSELYEKFPDFKDGEDFRPDGYKSTRIYASEEDDKLRSIDIMFKTDTDVAAKFTEMWGEPRTREFMDDEIPYWTNAEDGVSVEVRKGRKDRWSVEIGGFTPIASILGDAPAPPAGYGDIPLNGTRADVDKSFPDLAGKDDYKVVVPGGPPGLELKFDFAWVSGDTPKPIQAFVVDFGYRTYDDPLGTLTAKWGEPEAADGDNNHKLYNWVNAETGVRAQLEIDNEGMPRQVRFELHKGLEQLFPEKPAVPEAFAGLDFGADRAAIDKALPQLADESQNNLDFSVDGYNHVTFRISTDFQRKDISEFQITFDYQYDQDPKEALTKLYGEAEYEKDEFTKKETYAWYNPETNVRYFYEPTEYSSTLSIQHYAPIDQLVNLDTGQFFDGTPVPTGVSKETAAEKLAAYKAEATKFSVTFRLPLTTGYASIMNHIDARSEGYEKVVNGYVFNFSFGDDEGASDKIIEMLTEKWGKPTKVAPKMGSGTVYRFSGKSDIVADLKIDGKSANFYFGLAR